MRLILNFLAVLIIFVTIGCESKPKVSEEKAVPFQSAFADVNGTKLYYEIHGSQNSEPLVLLHGGGSDIYVSFGKGIQDLAKHFKVIAIDEQGHGKSPVSDRPFGFTQTADDIAELLKQLKIQKANFLGFSNGATTGMYLAIRHPKMVKKMVLGSGLYLKRGAVPEFWKAMATGTIENMPVELKEAYAKRSPRPQDLIQMFNYDATRMKNFRSIPESAMRKVQTPTLIMQTDQDVPTVEHGLEISRLLPNGRFAVIPGPHDNFMGNVTKASSALTQASITIVTEYFLSAE